jgi:uncharacterized protein HemY
MEPLGPPDSLHLRAAEGWLGLGDYESASQELEKISAEFQAHPEVLATRYCVYAAAKKWDACVKIGHRLVEQDASQSFGWINRSYAIRRATGGSVQAAYEALLPAAERLDDLEQVTFNLACYACQLGKSEEARDWLAKAFTAAARSGRLKLRQQEALADADLQPLWSEIRDALNREQTD